MSFDSSDIMITLGPMSRTFARATSGASAAVGVAAPMTTISIAEIHPHSQPQTQPLVGLEGFAIAATLLVFALSTQLRRRLRGRSGLVRAVP